MSLPATHLGIVRSSLMMSSPQTIEELQKGLKQVCLRALSENGPTALWNHLIDDNRVL